MRALTRHLVPFVAAVILAVASLPAAAQEVPQRMELTPIADEPLQPLGETGQTRTFQLALNKAHVVEFTTPVANIVLGNEAIADVYVEPSNPRRVFLIARQIGSTNAYFMDAGNRIMDQAEIQVLVDSEGLRDAITRLMPSEDVSVSVYGSNVFLSGSVSSTTAASDVARIAERFVAGPNNVTNLLKVEGSQQVVLQVKVAEIDRATRKNLSASNTLTFDRTFAGLTAATSAVSPTGASNVVSGTLNLDIFDNNIGATTIAALERQALVKTLAEPTLTAMSGETASFLSGGETAVPSAFDDQGNVTVEYRDFGILLEFTPVVLDKGRISLSLVTEISSLDSANDSTFGTNVTYKGFATKRTETAVDLPSGGSIMLSGLLEDNVNDTINGMPFLKDLPILGALFRSTEFQLDRTELVVTVTAYLAEPTSAQNPLGLPTDGFETASDIDIYLLGRMHREYGKGDRKFWDNPLSGPFGYIMR
ncbi:MAG: type II and III secretion system protein family protein [Rhodospirillales bacterium]